jgi:hypothetical protein
VTLAVATLGASCALAAVNGAWRISLPLATIVRVIVVTLLAASVGVVWRTTGVMVVVELAAGSLFAIALLAALGELTPSERQLARSLLRRYSVSST